MKLNFKSSKGFTTADIIVSVILITVFITIITVAASALTTNQTTIKRQSQAMYYAITAIETAKGQEFSKFPKMGTSKIEGIQGLEDGYILDEEGNETPYYQTVRIQDFAEMEGNTDKQAEVLKKVTVDISYIQGKEEQKITLSTVVSDT